MARTHPLRCLSTGAVSGHGEGGNEGETAMPNHSPRLTGGRVKPLLQVAAMGYKSDHGVTKPCFCIQITGLQMGSAKKHLIAPDPPPSL